MERDARIYIAGHRGLVGSALVRRLERAGYTNLITRGRDEVDLTHREAVNAFFAETRPDYVFLAAARVGGIQANNAQPVDFLRDNLLIQTHVIDAAAAHNVRKLLFLGSSCIYPKFAPQPMPEDCLLTGELEPTNEWYAIAKIAGIKLCQAYRRQAGFNAVSVMPTNLYGPGDNFDLETSHVLPALIRKFHEARRDGQDSVVLWGSGTPRREFLHVDDLADACVFVMEHYEDEMPLNIGVGEDISIRELAGLIAEVVGFEGELELDRTRPDGTPRKLLDVSRLHALGWQAHTGLRDGIAATYAWYREHGPVA
ncbi:GDP-L-fucose synthase [Spectribacter hydrogenooxidans]|uniref:GDP-L-fucose synthase n=1 Tax=Spectribacter hydrogenoxidans TaxID=3075608 RepID=A0ABU3C2Q7_9GAMM|nr:GDP-L-fucose synthase [Salinisphaera sp. W335]MDT0635837.1 GDP-L-fucose synthase [Salinisphaera sp. W335]